MIALDIETVCNVKDCPGFGKSDNTCTDPHTMKKMSIGHAVDPWRNRITCIGIWDGKQGHVYRDLEDFKRDLMSDDIPDLIMHGGQFDWLTLKTHGVDIPIEKWKHDTRLLAHTCTTKVADEYVERYNVRRAELNKKLPAHIAHRFGKKYSLKVLAPYFLDIEPFWEDPSNHDTDEYVLKDCKYTYDLFHSLKKLMQLSEYQFYENKFMRYARMLTRATYRGIRIDLELMERMAIADEKDREALEGVMRRQWSDAMYAHGAEKRKELSAKYAEMRNSAIYRIKKPTQEKVNRTCERYDKLLSAACEKIPPFKFSSSKDRTWLLRDYFKYDITNYSGKESVDAEVAERLMREGHKELEPYIQWAKINKRLTSYYPNYRRLHVDGIIHPNFDPAGTRTGRLSSSNPNFQNIPPELKGLLIPREGYKFIEYDASQIEARLIALYTEDAMLQGLIAKDISLHSHNANEFLNLGCVVDSNTDEVKTKHNNERQATKQFNFSVFYGAGKNMIQGSFFKNGIKMPIEKCAEIRKKMRDEYVDVFDYHAEITEFFADGGVMSNAVGRPVSVENPSDAYMKGFNRLIQGSASDLNLQAALECQEEWDKVGVDANVLMLVHDSIRAEVPEKLALECGARLQSHMEKFKLNNKNGEVKLIAEGGILE